MVSNIHSKNCCQPAWDLSKIMVIGTIDLTARLIQSFASDFSSAENRDTYELMGRVTNWTGQKLNSIALYTFYKSRTTA